MMEDDVKNRPYACEFCELRFKDSHGLKRHKNVVHTNEETLTCHICASVFYTQYKLNVHQAQKHEVNNKLRCEQCKKYFFSDFTFEKHTKKCALKSCYVCRKEFLTK